MSEIAAPFAPIVAARGRTDNPPQPAPWAGGPPIPTMTLVNQTGDITIGWTAETADRVMPMIQRKLDAGYSFWIIDRRQNKIAIKSVTEAAALREVVIRDEDAQALLANSHIFLVSDDGGDIETVRRVDSAEEVAQSQTVAIAPKRGG